MGFYVMAFGVGFTLAPLGGTLLLAKFGGVFCWAAMFVIGAISAAIMGFFTRE